MISKWKITELGFSNCCDEAFSFFDYNDINDLCEKNHVFPKEVLL